MAKDAEITDETLARLVQDVTREIEEAARKKDDSAGLLGVLRSSFADSGRRNGIADDYAENALNKSPEEQVKVFLAAVIEGNDDKIKKLAEYMQTSHENEFSDDEPDKPAQFSEDKVKKFLEAGEKAKAVVEAAKAEEVAKKEQAAAAKLAKVDKPKQDVAEIIAAKAAGAGDRGDLLAEIRNRKPKVAAKAGVANDPAKGVLKTPTPPPPPASNAAKAGAPPPPPGPPPAAVTPFPPPPPPPPPPPGPPPSPTPSPPGPPPADVTPFPPPGPHPDDVKPVSEMKANVAGYWYGDKDINILLTKNTDPNKASVFGAISERDSEDVINANIAAVLNDVMDDKVVLIPVNLHGERDGHWVGLAVSKGPNGINAIYQNSRGTPIDVDGHPAIPEYVTRLKDKGIKIIDLQIEQQTHDSDSCGPFTVENLVELGKLTPAEFTEAGAIVALSEVGTGTEAATALRKAHGDFVKDAPAAVVPPVPPVAPPVPPVAPPVPPVEPLSPSLAAAAKQQKAKPQVQRQTTPAATARQQEQQTQPHPVLEDRISTSDIPEGMRTDISAKQQEFLRGKLSTLTLDEQKAMTSFLDAAASNRHLVNENNPDIEKILKKNKAIEIGLNEIEVAGYRELHKDQSFKNIEWKPTANPSISLFEMKNADDKLVSECPATTSSTTIELPNGTEKEVKYRTIDLPLKLGEGDGPIKTSMVAYKVNGRPMPEKGAVFFHMHYNEEGKLTEVTSPIPLKFMGKGDEAAAYFERNGEIYTLPVTRVKYEAMMQAVAINNGLAVEAEGQDMVAAPKKGHGKGLDDKAERDAAAKAAADAAAKAERDAAAKAAADAAAKKAAADKAAAEAAADKAAAEAAAKKAAAKKAAAKKAAADKAAKEAAKKPEEQTKEQKAQSGLKKVTPEEFDINKFKPSDNRDNDIATIKKGLAGKTGAELMDIIKGEVKKGNIDTVGLLVDVAKLPSSPSSSRKPLTQDNFQEIYRYGMVQAGSINPNLRNKHIATAVLKNRQANIHTSSLALLKEVGSTGIGRDLKDNHGKKVADNTKLLNSRTQGMSR